MDEDTSVAVAEVVVVVEVVDALLPLNNCFSNAFCCFCCSALLLAEAMPLGPTTPTGTCTPTGGPPGPPAVVMVTPKGGTEAMGAPCNIVVGFTD